MKLAPGVVKVRLTASVAASGPGGPTRATSAALATAAIESQNHMADPVVRTA